MLSPPVAMADSFHPNSVAVLGAVLCACVCVCTCMWRWCGSVPSCTQCSFRTLWRPKPVEPLQFLRGLGGIFCSVLQRKDGRLFQYFGAVFFRCCCCCCCMTFPSYFERSSNTTTICWPVVCVFRPKGTVLKNGRSASKRGAKW